ncbi:MAG: outer membrane protein assembly factor BamB family protein [Planctomycetota bacterium]
MKATSRFLTKLAFVVGVLCAPSVCMAQSDSYAPKARQILDAGNIKGGLIVHIGCGDGKLTAALRANDRYLVHGLDANADNVRQAREHIKSVGGYGNVSVDLFNGKHLPYIDNLVNLVVLEEPTPSLSAEAMRVVCPGGVVCAKRGDGWSTTTKPRPAGIDEWTHYLYDASGNAVSQDQVVGPPRRFQWVGSPRWARHHDRRASVSAMVSAGGRIFYIFDEGSTASIMLPPKTVLIARDAFNGTILWKRSIPEWFTHLWPFKSGPAQLQRRLVAVGDRVYVTLGLDAPLLALDAATGETIRTYESTHATEEVIWSDGVLFALVNKSPQSYDAFKPQEVGIGAERDRIMEEFPWNEKPRQIVAIGAETGKILWNKEYPVVPLSPAADGKRVYFHDGDKVVALNRKTGGQIWRSDPVERRAIIPTNITPTLVVYKDVVLFYGATRKLSGLSAETGKVLWTEPHPKSGHYCPEDVLVAGGLVWGGEIAGGRDSGKFIGRDPQTGRIDSEFLPDINIYFMHHRCYRSKATERFLIPGWTGTEFVDFRKEHWVTNHWVRGGCIYGVMPSNGLLYAPAHSCACYMQAKLYGFCTLAPEAEESQRAAARRIPARRLQRGPAYGKLKAKDSMSKTDGDWPTYRGSGTRSGFAETAVPTDLEEKWNTDIGGRLSAPVIANGRLLLASVDTHTVHALDADSGEPLWTYTVGGRVDSPPTVCQGRALFGSADGYVYCLDASDGTLAWRFRAAPEDRRMASFAQVESVWPVHGSVLVKDGVVHCVAGRSMFLDGGLRYLRLDAKTGRKLGEVVFDERDPVTGDNLQAHVKIRNMPVGLPDVLSTDGKYLYMRAQRFDFDGKRYDLAPHSGKDAEQGAVQEGEGVHLFSPTGFLDDTWWHRSYWVYGRTFAEGAGGWPQAGRFAPGGRIMVVGDSNVYGFGRKPMYFQWRTPLEYHLFSASRDTEIIREPVGRPIKGKTKDGKPRRQMIQHPRYNWSRPVPLLVRAMLLAHNALFIAGPPDVVDEEEAFRNFGKAGALAKLAEQDAVSGGKKGARLWAVSPLNGENQIELELDSIPVFDGMAAAYGRLYISMEDGSVRCVSKQFP